MTIQDVIDYFDMYIEYLLTKVGNFMDGVTMQ